VSQAYDASRGKIEVARDQGVTRRVSSEVARRAFSVRAIGEVVGELRRVTWPTREETLRLSIMVVAVAVAMGIFLGLVDLIFAEIMGIVLGN
jgi:preprotein translocase SecE subunit